MPFDVAIGDHHEYTKWEAFKDVLAEFNGTFLFVFAGLAAVQAVDKIGGGLTPAGLVAIALAQGIAYFVTLAISIKVSGGHLNPAITFGLVLGGQLTVLKGLLYWIAQLVGASLAAALLSVIALPSNTPVILVGAGETVVAALVFEAVGAFTLVFAVYALVVDGKDACAPLAIGLLLAGLILGATPFSGGAFNPARAFGPALLAANWADQWIYWVGDLVGAFLAALIYLGLFRSPPSHAPLASSDY